MSQDDQSAHYPEDVVLFKDELASLVLMPPWYVRLFVHLVQISDRTTGQGQTSYAELVRLLAPLQPASGPKFDVPTAKVVRTALDRFVDAGIVSRSSAANAADRTLRFAIAPRS